MSGLAGIWNLDGEPVSRDLLVAMSAHLAHRGPDGENTLLTGAAGFAFQKMSVTPESLSEVQPARSLTGAVLQWDGRLDNRKELASTLGCPSNPSDPDSRLVLAAYDRYGEDFLCRLDGDFALSLFDPARRVLLLARDPMGGRSLHYCRFDQHVLFASEAKAFFAHPAVRTSPDEEALAEWLFLIPDASAESRTFFQDILNVPHGTVVRITPDGKSLRRFWDFDPAKRLRLKDHGEYVARYKALFERAVTNRARSAFPLTASVSGGLDSSSIFCVLLDQARHSGISNKITGLTFAGDELPTDEHIYQAAIEEKYALKLERLPLEALTMLGPEQEKSDAWHSEGPYLKWNLWTTLLDRSVKAGARVSFSGYFGDNILTNPHYLLDLLKRGKLVTFKRHWNAFSGWWEGVTSDQTFSALSVYLKSYLVPEHARPLYHRIRRYWRSEVRRLPWFSERLLQRALEIERKRSLLKAPSCSAHARVLFHGVRSRRLNVRNDLDVRADARHSCEIAYPYRDRELISFLMSVPGEVAYKAGARGLQREAATGVLPELVRTRRNKGVFTGPASRGALLDLDHLQPRLEKGLARTMGYLAPNSEFSQAIEALRARIRLGNDGTSVWWAYELVALEEWLTAFFAGR